MLQQSTAKLNGHPVSLATPCAKEQNPRRSAKGASAAKAPPQTKPSGDGRAPGPTPDADRDFAVPGNFLGRPASMWVHAAAHLAEMRAIVEELDPVVNGLRTLQSLVEFQESAEGGDPTTARAEGYDVALLLALQAAEISKRWRASYERLLQSVPPISTGMAELARVADPVPVQHARKMHEFLGGAR